MKTIRFIQAGLILLFGVLCFTVGLPLKNQAQTTLIEEPDQAGVYFRFNVYPRGGYYYYYDRPYQHYYRRSEVNITVKQDLTTKERIQELYLDGRRISLNSPSARGYLGSYFFVVNPGSHTIEWIYITPKGKTRQISRQFDIGYGQRLDFFISGDEFYQR